MDAVPGDTADTHAWLTEHADAIKHEIMQVRVRDLHDRILLLPSEEPEDRMEFFGLCQEMLNDWYGDSCLKVEAVHAGCFLAIVSCIHSGAVNEMRMSALSWKQAVEKCVKRQRSAIEGMIGYILRE